MSSRLLSSRKRTHDQEIQFGFIAERTDRDRLSTKRHTTISAAAE